MGKKTGLTVLGAALLAIILALLRETYWSILVDFTVDHLAGLLGIEKARIVGAVTPFAVAFAAASLVVTATYQIGLLERRKRPKLKILFDPNSQLNVETKRGLYGSTGEFYSVGIENAGSSTIMNVTLRALDSWFTQEAIAVAQGVMSYGGKPVPIIELRELHPGAPEYQQMFGLDYASHVSSPDYIFNKKLRFVLEAIGQDTPAVRLELQYDPQSRPMLQLVS